MDVSIMYGKYKSSKLECASMRRAIFSVVMDLDVNTLGCKMERKSELKS